MIQEVYSEPILKPIPYPPEVTEMLKVFDWNDEDIVAASKGPNIIDYNKVEFYYDNFS